MDELVKMTGVVNGVDQKTKNCGFIGKEVNLGRVRR